MAGLGGAGRRVADVCGRLWGRAGRATRRSLVCSAVCASGNAKKDFKKMTPKEWKKHLTPQQYYVTREAGTEPAFTGEFYDHHEKGMYLCVCCGSELFSSEAKYDSGSGWPSFHSAAGKVSTHTDRSFLMVRTEVLCGECNAHLGHVFPDGPEPTGLRYCINSLSLKFSQKT
ncbi:peptide methionine sulfoxide reductase MsrB-like [Scylla paramamosain]|uniref:peptide methionine sulfoxide reductase MsrB-like n=1 Tax=Scylla paramamosain TaxID=85552 RepID=UPI003083067B